MKQTVVLRHTYDRLDIPTVIRRDMTTFWSSWTHFVALVSTGEIFWR